ncbi:MAG: phosphatase PAP2 family protein [Flavobacteriaceae bacterium]|jgi:membrane-associated phospholipid phosphatase|nr:phosphatase PAP2 family protein [Flavobacteriaceae bacterium]
MNLYLKRLFPYLVLVFIGFPGVFYRRGWLFERLNDWHSPFLDGWFTTITWLGDATFAVFILLWLYWFKNYKWVYAFVLGFVLHVIFVHIFKQWIAHGFERPFLYYQQIGLESSFHWIEGVAIRKLNSFPSGHTATAFFFATFLSQLNRKGLVYLWLFLAIMVGLSRVYIGQHWFMDIYVGMLFGLWSTILSRYLVNRYPRPWFEKRRKQ